MLVVVVVRDVSARREAQEVVRKAEATLHQPRRI
jgi:hypothetical protein